MSKAVKSRNKHPFHFRVPNGDDVITAWATARYSQQPVTITLTAEYVRRAIESKGYGNTQTCAMARCVKGEAHKFGHPVEGYVDWQYRRAYVVSKVKAGYGPVECFVYGHNNKIAHQFDKKIGLKKLLKILEQDGPMEVTLLPIKHRSKSPQPKGKLTGERKKYQPRGAALRFAKANLGL